MSYENIELERQKLDAKRTIVDFVESPIIVQALAFAKACHKAIDTAIKELLEKYKQPPACVSCCTPSCCNVPPTVGISDALLAVDYLDKHGMLTKELLGRCRERQIRQSQFSVLEWEWQGVPCLFLENNRCQIYEVRPVMCRALFAKGNPAACAAKGPKVSYLDSQDILKLQISLESEFCREAGFGESFEGSLPGAIWAVGRNWHLRNSFKKFRRNVKRDWAIRLREQRKMGLGFLSL